MDNQLNNQPDPAWDYARIWECLSRVDAKLDELVTRLAQQENASPEYDKELYANLHLLAGALASTANLLKRVEL